MRMARKFFFPIRRNQVNFWSTSKAEKKKKKKKKKQLSKLNKSDR